MAAFLPDTLKNIMKNSDIEEFVTVDDTALTEDEKVELVAEVIHDEMAATGIAQTKKIDLINMVYLHIQGYDAAALAKHFSVGVDAIRIIKRSEKFKNLIALINRELISAARTFLTASGMKAVTTLIKCMDSNDERIRLNASKEVLDRIGLSAPEQIEIINKSDKISSMSEEELVGFIKSGIAEIKGVKNG